MDKYIQPIKKWLEENEEWWSNEPEFWLLQYDIVDQMKAENVGKESVMPILELMEKFPLVEFGTPGAFTHFIESIAVKDIDWYDELLVQSIKRCPSVHTVWLLNRTLNPSVGEKREKLLQLMLSIYNDKSLHEDIRNVAKNFLEHHEKL
jgi:hypothetical protein